MAEDTIKSIIDRTISQFRREIELLLKIKDDVDHLRNTESAMKAMLLDSKERSATSNLIAWPKKPEDEEQSVTIDLFGTTFQEVGRSRTKMMEKIHETYPNKKMGCGMAEPEHQSVSNGSKKRNLNIVSDDLGRQEVIRILRKHRLRREPLTVQFFLPPPWKVKVTATDDKTRQGVQSKFCDLENQIYDKGNDKVECEDFPGLEQELKKTSWGEIPDYLESIAIQIEKDRGKTTNVFHILTLVLLCAAIKEMEDFSVGDLDLGMLKKWSATLNYAKKYGFQVRFADNLLKKNLLAYFAIQCLTKSSVKI